MKTMIFLTVILFTSFSPRAQDLFSNPDSATIVLDDINHFWQAFDLLSQQKTRADSLKVIKSIFIDHASRGLEEYMKAANCYEQQYLDAITTQRERYLAIRKQTQTIGERKQSLIKYLHKFRQEYPELKIPSICFAIGKFEVAGTQFDNTLFIGCEKVFANGIDIVAQTIHEIAHFQQKNQSVNTNIDLAMIEGGAEFLTYRLTGMRTISDAWPYGISHEKNLWKTFKMELDSSIRASWFLDTRQQERPGSLGYFIGYRICESYLNRCKDKRLALKEIIEMKKPKAIFLVSQYER
jgi:uncharacterized protein YjaZ